LLSIYEKRDVAMKSKRFPTYFNISKFLALFFFSGCFAFWVERLYDKSPANCQRKGVTAKQSISELTDLRQYNIVFKADSLPSAHIFDSDMLSPRLTASATAANRIEPLHMFFFIGV
jgi:hypothetical protein